MSSMTDQQRSIWEARLGSEFNYITWQFRFQKLKRPPINIVPAQSFWGRWDPLNRCIDLSERLLLQYSWDVVLNVLKHEMAHQIMFEVYGLEDAGHGDEFKKCCEQLGLPRDFSKSRLDIEQHLKDHAKVMPKKIEAKPESEASADLSNHEDSNLLKRVEKLLALAESSNEHEAMLAMERAYHLLHKYNLDSFAKGFDKALTYLIIETKLKKVSSCQSHLASLLQEFYFVEVVFAFLYDPSKNEVFKTIELFGTEENVKMAEYVFYYLSHTIDNLWKDYQKRTGQKVKFKKSYQLGLIKGLSDKLNEFKQQHSKVSEYGLIVSTNKRKLNKFVANRYPKLRKSLSHSTSLYSNIYEQGRVKGKDIVIKKGVESKNSKRPNIFLGWQKPL